MHFTIELAWDRMSACKGGFDSRHQSINYLTPSTHNSGDYVPYVTYTLFEQWCVFFNVPYYFNIRRCRREGQRKRHRPMTWSSELKHGVEHSQHDLQYPDWWSEFEPHCSQFVRRTTNWASQAAVLPGRFYHLQMFIHPLLYGWFLSFNEKVI